MMQRPQFLLQALRRFLRPARHAVLVQLVDELVAAARQEGYHFSDVLNALAEYTSTASSVDPDTEQTRSTVASLLEAAAVEAETPGRELP